MRFGMHGAHLHAAHLLHDKEQRFAELGVVDELRLLRIDFAAQRGPARGPKVIEYSEYSLCMGRQAVPWSDPDAEQRWAAPTAHGLQGARRHEPTVRSGCTVESTGGPHVRCAPYERPAAGRGCCMLHVATDGSVNRGVENPLGAPLSTP